MTYIDVIYFLTGMIKSRLIVGVGGGLAKVGPIKNLAGGGVSWAQTFRPEAYRAFASSELLSKFIQSNPKPKIYFGWPTVTFIEWVI